MMPVLDDFEGVWLLRKDIADLLTKEAGTFIGRAEFRREGAGLAYREDGQLALGSSAPVQAQRRYLWRTEGDGIAVDYADGRAFHTFAADALVALHLCDPDRYEVAYHFADWPRWTAEWTVTGPRKDYRMVCAYRREGD
jgi:Family of unknown function (DUF6314)